MRKELVKYIIGSTAIEDDSQDSQEDKKAASTPAAISGESLPSSFSTPIWLTCDCTDRICMTSLKELIDGLGERVNYGLDLSDLPNGLPDGVDEIPAVSFRPSCCDVRLELI